MTEYKHPMPDMVTLMYWKRRAILITWAITAALIAVMVIVLLAAGEPPMEVLRLTAIYGFGGMGLGWWVGTGLVAYGKRRARLHVERMNARIDASRRAKA